MIRSPWRKRSRSRNLAMMRPGHSLPGTESLGLESPHGETPPLPHKERKKERKRKHRARAFIVRNTNIVPRRCGNCSYKYNLPNYETCKMCMYSHNLSHTKPYLRFRIQKPSVDLHVLSREATLPASQISSVNSFQNP